MNDESYHPEWPLSSSHADALASMRRSSKDQTLNSVIESLPDTQREKIEERSRALIVAESLRRHAANVEADGLINAARYMREAADIIETYRS